MIFRKAGKLPLLRHYVEIDRRQTDDFEVKLRPGVAALRVDSMDATLAE